MTPSTAETAVIATLLQFDTATLYESSAGDGEFTSGLVSMSGGRRVAGRALTVTCPAGDNLMLHAAVQSAVAGDIVVAQCHDSSHGVWGEVLTVAAQARGVVGLVIDGCVRDVEALRAREFSVYARGTALRGARKERPGYRNVPVSCAGALVRPGDYVVADESGVVFLFPGSVDETLARAHARQQQEEDMMLALRAGSTTVDLLDLGKKVSAANARSIARPVST